MSSFKFLFFGWLFASQKKREMHSISRPEFASQTRAFQGSVRTSCYLHSFATLRNWLRQPLQSLPLFKIKKLEIEPSNYFIMHLSCVFMENYSILNSPYLSVTVVFILSIGLQTTPIVKYGLKSYLFLPFSVITRGSIFRVILSFQSCKS